MGRFLAARPTRHAVPTPVSPSGQQVADPRRGTGLVLAYAVAGTVAVLAWAVVYGTAVSLPALELIGFVALAACAGQIGVLVGPRTWYSPTTPLVVLAGLVGGPLAGALTGAATESLGSDRVWRQRLMGSSRSALEGFAAGIVGVLTAAGATGSIERASAALCLIFLMAVITRAFVLRVRAIRPFGAALRTGVMIDAAETVIVFPIVAALLATQSSSPALAVGAAASVIALLAVAERAHARQAAQLELERTAARTDTLTSAPNRLALDEAIVLEHARIVRGARAAGLFIVDLDNFKLANDLHGHDVGDAVLVETVTRLRRGLRDTDLVARWGGDELIVLAPDMGSAEALESFGERIRRIVGDEPFRLRDGDHLAVTVSVGGTLLDGSTPPDVVLKRADVAVYRAKQSRDASVVEIPASGRTPLALVPPAIADTF
jgi:diguanylate cyclase (GGDEF)-like protein